MSYWSWEKVKIDQKYISGKRSLDLSNNIDDFPSTSRDNLSKKHDENVESIEVESSDRRSKDL